jgi:beta-phosphoglucomutase-like phosphatase (HAD superfamily)
MIVAMARGLVLDFDGTILDTEGPLYRSWAELWEDHGHELALVHWQRFIGTDGGFDPWRELEQRVGGPLDRALEHRRRRRRDELVAREAVRPGIEGWLAAAQRLSVPVGIASSSPIGWVEPHLERLGLRHRFVCLVCCDAVTPAKPDPTSYRLACRRLGADPRRSVAVEDSAHGVSAAVGAGLFTVAIPHQWTAGSDLSPAHRVLSSLDQMRLVDALAEAERRPRTDALEGEARPV